MPTSDGHFKGQGWTRRRESGWLRAFNKQERCNNKVTTPRHKRCWKGTK